LPSVSQSLEKEEVSTTPEALYFLRSQGLPKPRPRLIFLENVKGLLSHDGGRTFSTIISALDELGYDVQWQVLNSKNFGVPQNRERVFIIGHLRGTPRPQVFPFREGDKEPLETSTKDPSICPPITGQGGRNLRGAFIQNPSLNKNGSVTALDASYYKGYGRRGNKWRAMATEPQIRRLTPTECERLQGFPDNWTEKGLSSTMGVCVNINPAIENLLQKLDTVYFTTNDGLDTEVQTFQLGSDSSVMFAVDGLVLENSVTDITNHGKGTVIHYSQKEILNIGGLIKKKNTIEKTGSQSISKLWNVILDERLSREKLSITLTSIHAIMKSPIFTSVKTGENITGYTIHLNSAPLNYSNGVKLNLMVRNIQQTSDTQRYKTLGNAVTVNVIQAIALKLTQ
jgi:site-specific DNA-cytosine methylase